jgi:predicted dehydrogenase
MKIQPIIVGSGNAGKAVAKSLAIVGIIDPQFEILPSHWLARGQSLETVPRQPTPLLCITNPHGLHASYVAMAAQAGFSPIFVDKPAAVTREQIASLRNVTIPVLVSHGYRQMWGPQTLRRLIASGELGPVFSIEGVYWQSSAAQRADENARAQRKDSWKNDIALNGASDVLVDLGAHWVDLVTFLSGESVTHARGWLAYANAEAAHRDTHVQLTIDFASGLRAFGSISKTVHGAGNQLRVSVLGERQSATWSFETPDRLEIGRGTAKTVLARPDSSRGSQQAPFHGAGWLEGYIDILHQAALLAAGKPTSSYPTLEENLVVMERLLDVAERPEFRWHTPR